MGPVLVEVNLMGVVVKAVVPGGGGSWRGWF